MEVVEIYVYHNKAIFPQKANIFIAYRTNDSDLFIVEEHRNNEKFVNKKLWKKKVVMSYIKVLLQYGYTNLSYLAYRSLYKFSHHILKLKMSLDVAYRLITNEVIAASALAQACTFTTFYLTSS